LGAPTGGLRHPGLNGPVSAAEIDRIEAFFSSRGARLRSTSARWPTRTSLARSASAATVPRNSIFARIWLLTLGPIRAVLQSRVWPYRAGAQARKPL